MWAIAPLVCRSFSFDFPHVRYAQDRCPGNTYGLDPPVYVNWLPVFRFPRLSMLYLASYCPPALEHFHGMHRVHSLLKYDRPLVSDDLLDMLPFLPEMKEMYVQIVCNYLSASGPPTHHYSYVETDVV